MFNNLKNISATICALLLLSTQALAQRPEVEMADTLRSNGKIYIVVIILCILFLGIAAYLFSIDRKIKRLEQTKKD